ncbi:hypothetical protein FB451DRAFT_1181183 [Mycena latifolia]|nr:hypothetical protein FB451DRAFT_1181183 [Mycena latifolia]
MDDEGPDEGESDHEQRRGLKATTYRSGAKAEQKRVLVCLQGHSQANIGSIRISQITRSALYAAHQWSCLPMTQLLPALLTLYSNSRTSRSNYNTAHTPARPRPTPSALVSSRCLPARSRQPTAAAALLALLAARSQLDESWPPAGNMGRINKRKHAQNLSNMRRHPRNPRPRSPNRRNPALHVAVIEEYHGAHSERTHSDKYKGTYVPLPGTPKPTPTGSGVESGNDAVARREYNFASLRKFGRVERVQLR